MKTEIKTIQDVKAFAYHLVKNDKLSFHPDDDFESYISTKNDLVSPFYSKQEAMLRNKLMDDCFIICKKKNIDIYEIMFQITSEQINNQISHS